MKNILKATTAILLFMSITFIACEEKHEDNGQDTEAPTINIISPTATDSYMSGDTVSIQANFTDNDQLHEISASLTRTHNGQTEEVWTYSTHSHTTEFTLSETYVVEVPGMHNEFELTVEASDHNGNSDSKTISFHVHM